MRMSNSGQSRTRRAASLLVGGLLASMIGATPAHAVGPTVFCAQAFGHEVPAAPCDPNPNQFGPPIPAGKSYPSSYLYVSSGGSTGFSSPPKGTIWVEGNATPGATVSVTVTDGIRTLGPFFVEADLQGSPSGPRKGDFRAEIQVAELGGHRATPESDPDNIGDDELGPTLLTITLIPRQAGTTGTAKRVELTKHAASAGDVTKPALSGQKWPPRSWERNCVLDLPFWALDVAINLLLPANPPAAHQCAVWPVAGTITEETASSATRFSEISDVRIEVTKGTVSYLDARDSVEGEAMRRRGEAGILTRSSSNFTSYRLLLSSYQFPPNNGYDLGMDDPYFIKVTVCDAWGSIDTPTTTPNNCTVSISPSIVVTPY